MATVLISAPVPTATVHSQFTVTGTVTPVADNIIRVLVRNNNTGNLAYTTVTADANGNWSASFTVNPDNFQNVSTLMAWSAADEADQGNSIIA